MELARAMDLARSLSNDILGKLCKEFRPDFFIVEALPIGNRFLKNILKFVLQSSSDLHLKFTIPKFCCFSSKLCRTSHK
jgi:predicted glycosyltransferase